MRFSNEFLYNLGEDIAQEACSHQHVVQNDKYLLWGIDDPSVVAKLEHTKHRREYTVGQEESQPLRTIGIVEMANKHLF